MKRRQAKPVLELEQELEKICAQLFDCCHAYTSTEVLRQFKANKFSTTGAADIAKELAMLHQFFVMMREVCETSLPIIAQRLLLLKGMQVESVPETFDKVFETVKLTLPRTRVEHFRRALLRCLWNALAIKPEFSERTSLMLGQALFESSDDAGVWSTKGIKLYQEVNDNEPDNKSRDKT